jgi:hypothetical protein
MTFLREARVAEHGFQPRPGSRREKGLRKPAGKRFKTGQLGRRTRLGPHKRGQKP